MYVEPSKEDITLRDDWMTKIKAIIHPPTTQEVAQWRSYVSFVLFDAN